MRKIEKNISETLAYFNLFQMPLTSWEIYKNLFNPEKNYFFSEILETLENMKNKSLHEQEGFYFFAGEEKNIAIRKERYLIANEKIKKARQYLRLIGILPFVRAIFICNDLGYLNAPEGSDIDLAIIAKKNRIWTARFFSTLLMAILRKRPTAKSRKNKICLSFYITEDNLSLEKIAYENDIHFVYWINQFMPIFQMENLAERFSTENEWTRRFLPHSYPHKTNDRWSIKINSFAKNTMEFFIKGKLGDLLETILKKIQLKLFPRTLELKKLEENTDVIINDKILKFHCKDCRLEIKKNWKEKTGRNVIRPDYFPLDSKSSAAREVKTL
ncbi:hypothetical protein KKC32_02855 [Patescibacteria group bacterium]|nr:hypothetical protein [Patescibacteria group bacterium]